MDTENARTDGWMDGKDIMFETNERLFFLVVFDWLGGNFVRLGRNYRDGCMSRILSE
jgi:hypothetical protein